MSLSVCSVNVRGIRQSNKRRDVFHYLKGLGCAMYCLVDTHFTPDMGERVRSEWGCDVFLSCGTRNSRGIAVLPTPGAAVIIHNSEMDEHGNYIVMDVEFDGLFRCTFVVLYGPNDDNPKFFRDLFGKVFDSEIGQLPIILVGDWNFVLDFEKDRKFYRQLGNPRARSVVLDAIDHENLIDIWREQHPSLYRYTWKRFNPVKYSRLDFFLVSADLVPSVTSSDIIYGHRTDHNIVSLTFKKQEKRRRNFFLEI